MKLWSDYFDWLLPDLPGCTVAAAQIALLQSARRFCKESHAWTEWMDPTNTRQGVQSYAFSLTNDQEVVMIKEAKLDDADLPILRSDQGDERGVMVLVGREDFQLQNIDVTDDQVLKTRCVLMPSLKAKGVLTELSDQWTEAIVHGAKAILMISPKKPYSDVNLGAFHEQRFKDLIAAEHTAVFRAFSRTPARVTPQYF